MPDAALDYGDPRGDDELRAELAAYLVRVRGRGGGATLVRHQRLHAGAVADVPGAGGARGHARRGRGPVAGRLVGDDPLRGPRGRRAAGRRARRACWTRLDADAVLVTPAHQFPTGAVLAPERRRALLAWGGIVIEDDYDSEYRYDRAPVGTLQRLAPDRVVYLGTASKTLAPGAAARLAASRRRSSPDAIARERWAVDSGGDAITARAYARLLATGEVDRHLRRTRREYRERRDRLVAALDAAPGCRVGGVAAGLHLLLRLPPGTDEAAVVAAPGRAADPDPRPRPATA